MRREQDGADHHPVRLPELRDARPGQDGLPRPAQPDHPRRRASTTSRPTAARTIDLESLSKDLDDQPTYELLARGDTLGRLPARRRRHADAAAPDAAGQLRGHLGRRSRSTGPGPMGANTHTNYALRKTGRQEIDADPPRAGGAARGDPGRDLRPDRLPGAGQPIAQKVAGYSLGQADLLRRAMGKKKKEVLDAEFVPFEAGMRGQRLLRRRRSRRCGTSCVPFSDYAFNKAHTAAYGLVSYWTAYLKANYPAEYMAALLTSVARRQGQVGALPQRVPADGHQGAAARRQRVGRQLHRRRHRHPVRPGRDPQRRRQRRRRHRRGPRGRRAGSPRSRTSCARCPPVVCNKRTIESLIKAGAFDSLGDTRPGLVERARGRRRRVRRGQAQGGHRPGLACSAASATTDAGDGRRRGAAARSRSSEWDKQTLLAVRARDARALRLRPPAVRHRARPRPARRHLDRRAAGRRGPAGRRDGHHRRAGHRRCRSRRTKKGDLWAIAHGRGPRGRHRGAVLPPDLLHGRARCCARTSSASSGAGVNRRDDGVALYAQELTLPDISEGPRGPVVVSCR